MSTSTIYISIGNSDDKLSQLDWSRYVDEADRAVSRAARYVGTTVHGRWYSLATEPWQNACWCVEIDDELVEALGSLRDTLAGLAKAYGQDSVAWATAQTEFIGPAS